MTNLGAKNNKLKVLFVGQTPPPYGGQAIMQQVMLEKDYRRIEFLHVRMAFSKEMDEVGRFSVKKIFHLFSVIFQIIKLRIQHNIQILYYPPAGPNRIPVYRDMVILLATRWLFKKTIFHFHAGGISECYQKLSAVEQMFFRLAYFQVDLSIRLSELSPPDGDFMECKKEVIIPNGIADKYPDFPARTNTKAGILTILFVGILRESKGILVLLEACRLLEENGQLFRVQLMGKFASKSFEKKVLHLVERYHLKDHVDFLGVCTGSVKWQHYHDADIFCFPSFFESEAFPVVLLEAMQFKLPIVTTRWRGIPSMITDGESGFLVEIQDSRTVAEKLSVLLGNKEMRCTMGDKGRQSYLSQYTLDIFRDNIEKAVLTVPQ